MRGEYSFVTPTEADALGSAPHMRRIHRMFNCYRMP